MGRYFRDMASARDHAHANWENPLAPLIARPSPFSPLHSHFVFAPNSKRENAFAIKKADEGASIEFQALIWNQSWLEVVERYLISLDLEKTKALLSHENWRYADEKTVDMPSLRFYFDLRQLSLDRVYAMSKSAIYERLPSEMSVALGLASYLAHERMGTSLPPCRREDLTICFNAIVNYLMESARRR